MGIADAIGRILSAVALQPRRIKLTSPEVAVTAQRGEMQIEETRYTGKKCIGTFGYARLIFGKLETVANCVVEKAKNVYRTVTGLTQLRTGRMRTKVDATWHFKSNKAYLKADRRPGVFKRHIAGSLHRLTGKDFGPDKERWLKWWNEQGRSAFKEPQGPLKAAPDWPPEGWLRVTE